MLERAEVHPPGPTSYVPAGITSYASNCGIACQVGVANTRAVSEGTGRS
jgi:hypothetical protein